VKLTEELTKQDLLNEIKNKGIITIKCKNFTSDTLYNDPLYCSFICTILRRFCNITTGKITMTWTDFIPNERLDYIFKYKIFEFDKLTKRIIVRGRTVFK